jgi:GNAT superfamily N-acetyltransferase
VTPMRDGLVVRRATIDDLDVVVELRLALLREYSEHPVYGRLRPDAARRARPIFAMQLDSENEVVLLAEDNGKAVGLVRCIETISSPLLEPDRYCYLSSVYVRPDWRRRGVLNALFERAVAWCRGRDISEMRLHNVGSRESTAAAWDALGFKVVEQVRVRRIGPDERPRAGTAAPRPTPHAPEARP